jgi:hypothetical protein
MTEDEAVKVAMATSDTDVRLSGYKLDEMLHIMRSDGSALDHVGDTAAHIILSDGLLAMGAKSHAWSPQAD